MTRKEARNVFCAVKFLKERCEMDCKQAEFFMMQHMEKTIKPADARDLAKHILACETCRESYLMFDECVEFMEAAETAEGFELTEAPKGFTESVMTKVCALEASDKAAVYLKTSNAVQISFEPETGGGQVVLRVLWGLSAIILGIGLLFIYNPPWLEALAGSYPVVDSINNVLIAVGGFFNRTFDWIAQDASIIAADNLSIFALLFVAVMGTLLYVLHNGEKSAQI